MDCRTPAFPMLHCFPVCSNSFTESAMLSNHLILCHPLLLLPSTFPSLKVFSNESALRIRWAQYWSFSFGISPSNEYSGLISFRIDWFDLLAVQVTLKSLLQKFERISSSVLSLLYSPTLTSIHDFWKNHSSTIQIFVDEVLSLLFNMLSRLIIAFLPRSKCLLISGLQSAYSGFGIQENKICHCLHFSLFYLP